METNNQSKTEEVKLVDVTRAEKVINSRKDVLDLIAKREKERMKEKVEPFIDLIPNIFLASDQDTKASRTEKDWMVWEVQIVFSEREGLRTLYVKGSYGLKTQEQIEEESKEESTNYLAQAIKEANKAAEGEKAEFFRTVRSYFKENDKFDVREEKIGDFETIIIALKRTVFENEGTSN